MKRTERTGLTVAKILEAALEEFGANGYSGGTVNNICKRGINKGLVYYNFKVFSRSIPSWPAPCPAAPSPLP